MATFPIAFAPISISLLLLLLLPQISLESKISKSFLFSDKTPYHFKRKAIDKPPNCEPVHINMVIRHGSRYSGTFRLNKMKEILEKINPFYPSNSTFHYKGLSLPWNFPDDVLNAASKEMSKLGNNEMYSIAKRLLGEFPSVLKHGYSNSNFSFVATDKLRSSQSATAFAQGLFEGKGHLGGSKYQSIAVKSSGTYNNDNTLRIYEACPKWQKVTRREQRRSEHAKFRNGPEMRKVIQNISKRLKLPRKFKLRPQMVQDMFLMCAFGVQTDSADGSWCEVFEDADLKVLEYLQDLKLYWQFSYGRKINYKMSCALYTEIIDSFQRFLQQRKPHGVFRFAHTGTVIPLLTMLGLYNDSLPPRADNFLQQANRKFRISDIVPMGANVAFVLYSCNGKSKNNSKKCTGQCQNKKTFDESDIKIQILVNEAAVPMHVCRGRMYCSLQSFLSHYSLIKNNCNINKICRKRLKCKKGFKDKGPSD